MARSYFAGGYPRRHDSEIDLDTVKNRLHTLAFGSLERGVWRLVQAQIAMPIALAPHAIILRMKMTFGTCFVQTNV